MVCSYISCTFVLIIITPEFHLILAKWLKRLACCRQCVTFWVFFSKRSHGVVWRVEKKAQEVGKSRRPRWKIISWWVRFEFSGEFEPTKVWSCLCLWREDTHGRRLDLVEFFWRIQREWMTFLELSMDVVTLMLQLYAKKGCMLW